MLADYGDRLLQLPMSVLNFDKNICFWPRRFLTLNCRRRLSKSDARIAASTNLGDISTYGAYCFNDSILWKLVLLIKSDEKTKSAPYLLFWCIQEHV